MAGLKLFLLCLVVAVAAAAAAPAAASNHFNERNYLRLPKSSRLGRLDPLAESCLSWRLSVETHNLRHWKVIPEACLPYVELYMVFNQYRADSEAVVDVAIEYAESLNVSEQSTWVFDIDETALSNLEYYAEDDVRFGAIRFNRTKFYEWVAQARAPALPATLRLYKKLVELGFKIVFIDGSSDLYRKERILNLRSVGYETYEKLILKPVSLKGTPSIVFKPNVREELVAAGYEIVGNIGDQWNDLRGPNKGRTFKLPNPMYYVE